MVSKPLINILNAVMITAIDETISATCTALIVFFIYHLPPQHHTATFSQDDYSSFFSLQDFSLALRFFLNTLQISMHKREKNNDSAVFHTVAHSVTPFISRDAVPFLLYYSIIFFCAVNVNDEFFVLVFVVWVSLSQIQIK